MKKKLILALCLVAGAFTAAGLVAAQEESELKASVTLSRRPLNEDEKGQLCTDTFDLKSFIYHPTPGALRGKFSVENLDTTKGDGKFLYDHYGITKRYVYFSQGNLQYMPPSNKGAAVWCFAEHQYDFLNRSTAWMPDPSTENANLWYDSFAAGTSGCTTNVLAYSTGDICRMNWVGENRQYDWGVYNAIFNGGNQPDLWRTLTYGEWRYVLTRKDKNNQLLYFFGTIESLYKGMFLLPDDFEDTDDLTSKRGGKDITMTMEQFEDLQNRGVVFLPVAPYWTSSAFSDGRHFTMNINATSYTDGYVGTSQFSPVRLVQDAYKLPLDREALLIP